MALLLTREGIAVVMHAAITGVEPVSLALRGRLRTLQHPTIVFRIGKPQKNDEDRPYSSRPPLSEIIF